MLISDLAKELKVTEKFLLKKLKTLKLKAKDGALTKIVEIVLRDALAKQGIGEAVKDEEDEAPKKKTVKKKTKKDAPKAAEPVKAVVAPVVKQVPKPPKPQVVRPSSPQVVRPSSPQVVRPSSPQAIVPPPPAPQSRPKVDVSKIEIPKEVYQFDPLKKKLSLIHI